MKFNKTGEMMDIEMEMSEIGDDPKNRKKMEYLHDKIEMLALEEAVNLMKEIGYNFEIRKAMGHARMLYKGVLFFLKPMYSRPAGMIFAHVYTQLNRDAKPIASIFEEPAKIIMQIEREVKTMEFDSADKKLYNTIQDIIVKHDIHPGRVVKVLGYITDRYRSLQ